MKKVCKFLLCCLIIASLLLTPVSAEEARASDLIVRYGASISRSGSELRMEMSIYTRAAVLWLGASTVELQAKINGVWEEVCTFNTVTNPEMVGSDTFEHKESVYYGSPQSGTEYRIQVTFFARTSDIMESRQYTSASYVA